MFCHQFTSLCVFMSLKIGIENDWDEFILHSSLISNWILSKFSKLNKSSESFAYSLFSFKIFQSVIGIPERVDSPTKRLPNGTPFLESNKDGLNYLVDLNNQIKNVMETECDKLKFSMDQIVILGKSMHFLALIDDENMKLQQLHSCMLYINDMCDDLHENMNRFANKRYAQFIARIPYNLTNEQILRFGNPSRIDFAVAVAEENLQKIKSLFGKNETKSAIDLAELKMLKISSEITKLSVDIKGILLKIEPFMAITKIKNDFLNKMQGMATGLKTHIHDVLKLDDLVVKINDCFDAIVNAQKRLALEITLSFIV